jgi:hypothetical protein
VTRLLPILGGIVVVAGLPFVMALDLLDEITRRLRGAA